MGDAFSLGSFMSPNLDKRTDDECQPTLYAGTRCVLVDASPRP